MINKLAKLKFLPNNFEIIEEGENLVFLHKVNKGKSEQSYGIQVAKLAGLPQKVINSANLYLKTLANTLNTSTI